jgi:hypothetical protein
MPVLKLSKIFLFKQSLPALGDSAETYTETKKLVLLK